MSLDSFGRFLRVIGEDPEMSELFAAALHDSQAPEAYAIVADFATQHGFNVSIDEAAAAHQRYVAMFEHEGELSDDLLGDVVGGLSGGARGIDWAAQYMHEVSEGAPHLGANFFRNW
ncbi:Nif11 family protein [Thalassospira tepidiphila]|jgi:hypothetical protein|uniref:Nif11-like leader peptide family natural product precursor n=1 Tax=Thalassospira tepidiphila TaxID=393657 RepID=UPI001BCD0ED3|nr:Nif11-like leader peptide family natural product precursor [Thalassospira tepidiphila]MBS8273575.1 Nif11 family protein [Thalassospira tepidiphila]